MPRYQVAHAYSSTRDGQRFGPWVPGDTVELGEEDAAWLNRDSPGCLLSTGVVEADVDQAAEGEAREKPAGANRQHRGGRNRSGS